MRSHIVAISAVTTVVTHWILATIHIQDLQVFTNTELTGVSLRCLSPLISPAACLYISSSCVWFSLFCVCCVYSSRFCVILSLHCLLEGGSCFLCSSVVALTFVKVVFVPCCRYVTVLSFVKVVYLAPCSYVAALSIVKIVSCCNIPCRQLSFLVSCSLACVAVVDQLLSLL